MTQNVHTVHSVLVPLQSKQEIRANAHETRDRTSLISCAGCLGLSQVISVKIHSLSVRCSVKLRKIH